MTIRFALAVARETFVVQEPVSVTLHFECDAPVAMPYEPSALDVLTLRLFDRDRNPLASANGYSRTANLGLEVVPKQHASLATFALPAGGKFAWTEDLTSFLDLPECGEYFVQARFAFPPSGFDVESELVPFRIAPMRCAGVDALTDTVAMNVISVAQLHRDGEDVRTIFHFRPFANAAGRWSGLSFFDTPPSAPRISKAAFTTRATYEHDFSKWLVWLHEGTLTLALIRDEQAMHVAQHDVGEGGWELVGRPWQHEDFAVTVLLRDGGTLRALTFDENAQPRDDTRTAIPASARPLARDHDGTLAWGADGMLPVRVSRQGSLPATLSVALPLAYRKLEHRIVRLQFERGAVSVVATCVLDRQNIAWHARGEHVAFWRLGDAEVVSADAYGGHAVAGLNDGRVVHLLPNGLLRALVHPEANEPPPRFAIATSSDWIELFIGTREEGVRAVALGPRMVTE